MRQKKITGIMIAIAFIWSGMLLGISFLEAPLKFQARDVTLSIGLQIGRLVFKALNKVECVYAVCMILLAILVKTDRRITFLIAGILSILLLQTLWLLPALDLRAQLIISGRSPAEESLHVYYVLFEIIKFLSLLALGFMLYSSASQKK